MFQSFLVNYEPFCQTEVYYMHCTRPLLHTEQKVVWLDVSVKEEALTCLVYRFEARDKLDEDQKGCFQAELASTYVEHVFECRAE